MQRQQRWRGPDCPARAAAALALALLLLAAWPAPVDARRRDKKPKLRLEDIVIAYPADTRHLEVARASRAWRKGIMRTFIANNVPPPQEVVAEAALHNETWSWYPDDAPRRSMYAGDSRAGLVPFLAHKHFGDTYKWLLYMDDDTIFFPDAVLRLLDSFDPDLPYFISDHFWWPDPLEPEESHYSIHPHKAAPRCLPCHFDSAPYANRSMPFPAPKGCPCTPELLCEADAKRPPHERVFNRHCDYPRHPWITYSMHGGAGGIMSIGLMRRVSFEFMEACTRSLYSTGGDSFISICLWQAGYALTDPGKGLYEPELQYFDPGPEDRYAALVKLSGYVEGNKWGARCNDTCQMQLENMVSLHVRSRTFETLDDAAEFIRAVSTMYESYAIMRRGKEQRAALARAAEEAAAEAAAAAAAKKGQDAAAARKHAEEETAAKKEAKRAEKKRMDAMPQAQEKATEMAHSADEDEAGGGDISATGAQQQQQQQQAEQQAGQHQVGQQQAEGAGAGTAGAVAAEPQVTAATDAAAGGATAAGTAAASA